MSAFDPYIFHILVFSPIIASIFLMLIPVSDTGSKIAISRFFSVLILFILIETIIAYMKDSSILENKLSIHLFNLNIQVNLALNKYNVYMYTVTTVVLLFNTISYAIEDAKTNIHHVSPFILTFFLFISYGQYDLRIALPILSIANFLLYFLIGFNNEIRRGSTIFHMGIFIFFCDALALVLLQIPISLAYKNIILLSPGLTRMLIPMFAPFMKKFILNIDNKEGTFLTIFLQLSGWFILLLVKNSLSISTELIETISTISLIGAIYIATIATTDLRAKCFPHYFLIFYSSLAACILFFSGSDFYYSSLSLFITNIICFFGTARFSYDSHGTPTLTWFMALFLGLPGLGIGTSLWVLIYQFYSLVILRDGWTNFWITTTIGWVIALLLISAVIILSTKQHKEATEKVPKDFALISFLCLSLMSWLIPVALFYKHKGF